MPATVAVVSCILLWEFTSLAGPDLSCGPSLMLVFSVGSVLTNVGYGGPPAMTRGRRFRTRKRAVITGALVAGVMLVLMTMTGLSGWSRAIGLVTVLVLHGIGARTRDRAYTQVRREFEAGKQAGEVLP